MSEPHWIDAYASHHPCAAGVAETKLYDTPGEWWAATKRGDWMLWLAARDKRIIQGSEAHRRLCYAVCLIWWELSYPWWYEYGERTGDTRPQRAIRRLEQWCRQPDAAAAAAAADAAAAARAAAAAAAAAAAQAAAAAEAAAAARAARAADAAAAARAADAAGAAAAACLERIAEIVRETCLEPVV